MVSQAAEHVANHLDDAHNEHDDDYRQDHYVVLVALVAVLQGQGAQATGANGGRHRRVTQQGHQGDCGRLDKAGQGFTHQYTEGYLDAGGPQHQGRFDLSLLDAVERSFRQRA